MNFAGRTLLKFMMTIIRILVCRVWTENAIKYVIYLVVNPLPICLLWIVQGRIIAATILTVNWLVNTEQGKAEMLDYKR